MIVVLIGVSETRSAGLRALASRLELAGSLVQLHDLELSSFARGGPEQMHHLTGMIREQEPDRIGLACTLFNEGLVLDLCARIRATCPRSTVVLWGAEAAARRSELLARDDVHEVLDEAPEAALSARLGGVEPGVLTNGSSSTYGSWLGELARSAVGSRAVVDVVPGCPLSVEMLRQQLPTTELGLSPGAAVERILPLLRAGVAVLLADPRLVGSRDPLRELLLALASYPAGRLGLELPAEALTDDQVEPLMGAGVGRLSLDLGAPHAAQLEALRGLRSPLTRLARSERPVQIFGHLSYGHPGVDLAALGQAIDASLQAGLDQLQLRPLLVPPGSRLRRSSDALAWAATAPYEVLHSDGLPPGEMLRVRQLAVTLSLVQSALSGTGVLRALATNLGSASEVLLGFGEHMAARGYDLLRDLPNGQLDRLLVDFLRANHGVDLELDTVRARLRRAPSLALRWLPDGRRLISDDGGGRVAHVGRGAMALIDRFDEPRTAFDVCQEMVGEAPPERRDKLRRDLDLTVEKLAALGFLVPASGGEPDEAPFTSLDEFDYHYRMLADTARVEAYQRAIAAVVTPGCHVVEIGTGTGILAVLAARAGARVTAIEQYSVMQVARDVARRAGLAAQINFVRGRSDLVQLDQPGDVLVSEIVGNRILNEGLMEMTIDARRRLLRPRAAVIPSRIEILAQAGHTTRFAHLERAFDKLRGRHDLDLTPMVAWFNQRVSCGRLTFELGQEDDDFQPLTDERVALDLDLLTLDSREVEGDVELVPERRGSANAVVLSFRLHLQPGIELSTCGAQHALHWCKPVHMLPAHVELRPGQPLPVRVGYLTHGEMAVSLRG